MAKIKKRQKKTGGPFLAAAVFCESVLLDTSGKISAVGISDGINLFISSEAPPDMPSKTQPATMMQNILIIFRSGDSPGKHRLRLVIEQPDGRRTKAQEQEIELSAPSQGGCNVRTQLQMNIYSSGVFLVDVILDGKRFTRMPFNVAYQRLPKTIPEITTKGTKKK
jgi:hypothetical protein